MITLRWWAAAVLVLLLSGAGALAGYLAAQKSPSPEALKPPSRPSASVRDPSMEAGAAFMARVTEYRQRLSENPKDLEALIFLGNANFDLGRVSQDLTKFDKAREYYEKALAINPGNIHVRTDLATCYFNLDRIDQAVSEMKTVLKRSPDHETALFNLGTMLLVGKKDQKGAIEVWQRLLAKHPDSEPAKVVREKIEELKRTKG